MRLTKRTNSQNWFLEAQINGKHFVRSTKTAHKPTARKIAEGLYRSLQVEAVQGPSKETTLKDAIDRYLSARKHLASSDNLKSVGRVVLRNLRGGMLLSEITGRVFNDFIEKRWSQGCKAQTVKHSTMFLLSVIKQAGRDGYNINQLEPTTISVKPTRLRYLSKDEEAKLLEELSPSRTGKFLAKENNLNAQFRRELQDNYDLVVLLLDTGARYGEIAKLQWDQIDLENKLIKLWRSKVGNESMIYLTTRAYEVLNLRSANKNSPKYVFTNRKGEVRGNGCIAIRRAIKRAGLHDCTIHTLRHTHATRLIQNGLSIYEVRSVLGHTDIKTTMRYAHLENVDVTQRARNVIEKLNNSHANL